MNRLIEMLIKYQIEFKVIPFDETIQVETENYIITGKNKDSFAAYDVIEKETDKTIVLYSHDIVRRERKKTFLYKVIIDHLKTYVETQVNRQGIDYLEDIARDIEGNLFYLKIFDNLKYCTDWARYAKDYANHLPEILRELEEPFPNNALDNSIGLVITNNYNFIKAISIIIIDNIATEVHHLATSPETYTIEEVLFEMDTWSAKCDLI